ncbi:MAG: hypoxanthine phosphoribosyltransferase [Synergistales bacterium]|nr:hypoxanthine phosphoribosyltransferase [Synergistales bacterium]
MGYSLSSTLISSDELKKRVRDIASEISREYHGQELVVVGILKGAVFFLSDLVREFTQDLKVTIDFMAVSSYGDSTKTSGIVRIVKDLDTHIGGKNVLIVEDIVDTGLTLSYLVKLLKERSPRSVRVCVLLDKTERRVVEVPLDFKGFEIPDRFVVGYGLDCAGLWRNLPDIMTVDQEENP